MKQALFLVVLAATLAACSDKPAESVPADEAAAKAAAAASAASAADNTPRPATYDPNLKVDPKTIVWESEEVKRRFEEIQARAAAQAASAAPAAAGN